jgi:hypothetical protein
MMSSSAYARQDYRRCSDQIVAEPKCNADERIFRKSAQPGWLGRMANAVPTLILRNSQVCLGS